MALSVGNMGPPLAVRATQARCCPEDRKAKLFIFRIIILMFTFVGYMSYHLSRKPISVVKTELFNCTNSNKTSYSDGSDGVNCTSWIAEINGRDEAYAKRLLGTLDTSYLFAYAFGMFFTGMIAERMDLRYFLSVGMVMSGVTTMAFGFGKWMGIHHIAYYVAVQVVCGVFQATGWPGVVTVVANWFGRSKKGLIFGIWNAHTSVGNILGSLIAGFFVESDWALSFIVPGAIIGGVGVIFFFLLAVRPEDAGLELDEHVPSGDRERYAARSNTEHEPLLSGSEDDGGDAQVIDVVSAAGDVGSDAESDIGPAAEEARGEAARDSHVAAITFWGALKIPGVVEFSLSLFFSKLVSYTFLYWLPTFIISTGIGVTPEDAAYLSTLFDVGGILGGIAAGLISDTTGKSASTCALMLVAAIPTLFAYESYGTSCHLNEKTGACYSGNVGLLLTVGFLVNGPYALITTAVSADLGRAIFYFGTRFQS